MKKGNIKSVNPEYPTCREFQRKKFLNIATALGIGVTAVTIPLTVKSAEEAPVEKNTDKKGEVESQKEKIILLVANLGHKEFKERENATVALIKLGKECVKKKDTKSIELIKAEMGKSKKSKDPEIKERAKKILLAITPLPPKTPNHIVRGRIRVKGGR